MAEQAPKRRRWLRLLLWTGAAVGAGLLLAPRTGRSSRAWVRQKFESLSTAPRDLESLSIRWADFWRGRLQGYWHKFREAVFPEEEGYVDDDLISERVRSALGRDRKTWGIERLNVDTFDRVVTLRGHVPGEAERRSAENVARSVRDVQGVANKIRVHEEAPGATDIHVKRKRRAG